jgi:ankyrin repeat protein
LKNTPICWAAYFGYIDIVQLLITSGADINTINSDGKTPLVIATERGNINVRKALIAAGASLY